MIDLLKNAKEAIKDVNVESEKEKQKSDIENQKISSEKDDLEKEKKNGRQKASKIKKPSITQYKDPEGLTVGKLELGLWFIRHRKVFINMFYGALIIVSFITWPRFLYTYGKYVFIDMRQDQNLANELVASGNINHSIVLNQAPLPLEIRSPQFLKSGENNYDFFVEITNPNEKQYGKFKYRFKVEDSIFPIQEGYISTLETKYIVSLANDVDYRLQNIEVEFISFDWQRITMKNFSNWINYVAERKDITISDKVYTPAQSTILSEKVNVNSLKFTVTNNTVYNYSYVDFVLLLYNRESIVGVNTYRINKLSSEKEQEVVISWVGNHGRVTSIEVIPNIDILNDEIYLRYVGEGGEIK